MDPVHFLQIWIHPDRTGVPPKYEERSYGQAAPGVLHLVASRGGRDGSIPIHQDADVYLGILQPGDRVTRALAPGRHAWVQVAQGEIAANGLPLRAGDGAAPSREPRLELTAGAPATVVVFDLN